MSKRRGSQRGSNPIVRSGSWYSTIARYTTDDQGNLIWKPVQVKLGPAVGDDRLTLKRAKAERDRLVGEANQLNQMPQGLATVDLFVRERYTADHIFGLSRNGQRYLNSILKNHVLPTLGGAQLRDVTPQMVQSLVNAKVEAGLSSETVKQIRFAISSILRHARNLRFIAGDLATDAVKLPRLERVRRQGALAPVQVEMLLAAVPEQYRMLIRFLVWTGVRIGEAAGLKWKRVNLTDQWQIVDGEALAPYSLAVRESYSNGSWTSTKTGTKGHRTIPLTSALYVELAGWREKSAFAGPDHTVFTNSRGGPIDPHNISTRVLKDAFRKIGVPDGSFHWLRHTASTAADAAGLTEAQRMAMLGHTQRETAARYAHPELETMRAKMERVN